MAKKDGKASVEKTEAIEEAPKEIDFHYVKSNFFRTIHIDGAYGGLTPGGGIFMGLFSQRFPIPQKVTSEIEDGQIGKEVRKELRSGIFREVEAGVIMDKETAINLRAWLGAKIKEIDSKSREGK